MKANKQYRFNNYGICENPDVYGIPLNYIKVALFPDGKWRFGASWNSYGANYEGGSFGCGFGWKIKCDIYAYNTERECIFGGLKYFEKYIDKYKKEGRGDCVEMQKCVEEIKKILAPKQLSLF